MDKLRITIFDPDNYEKILNAEKKENQRNFKTFQSKDIQSIAKISKTQLIHWTQQDLIVPLEDIRGRGKVRTYDYQNLVEALICRELSALSVETRYSKEILNWLRKRKWEFEIYYDQNSYDSMHILKNKEDDFTVLDNEKTRWKQNAPGVQGQQILELIENINEENRFCIKEEIERIIKGTNDQERPIVQKWLDELGKLNKKREEIIANLQERITLSRKQSSDVLQVRRICTIWEYLRLHPDYFEFYLIISIDRDKNRLSAFIYDIEGGSIVFKNKTSIIINLQDLVSEAGDIHERTER